MKKNGNFDSYIKYKFIKIDINFATLKFNYLQNYEYKLGCRKCNNIYR